MSENTQFLNMLVYGYPDNAPDPFFSRQFESLSVQARYNVVRRRMGTLALNSGDSVSVTPAGLALTDWCVIMVRVIGLVQLNVVGKDTDNTTTISGTTPGYGTDIYPGYIILSTYNLSSISISALADDSVAEYLVVISAEDS